MGNAVLSRGRGSVKLVKLDGQVIKLKAPVMVKEVLRDYAGYVVLHSEEVRNLGVRAKPLDGYIHLNPKHLYFLVELPNLEDYQNTPPRVRSGITMNAKFRLEKLLLACRSVSDMSSITSSNSEDGSSSLKQREGNGALRVKLRLPKAQLAKMMLESQDSAEMAKKLLESCLDLVQSHHKEKGEKDGGKHGSTLPWKPTLESIPESCKSIVVI